MKDNLKNNRGRRENVRTRQQETYENIKKMIINGAINLDQRLTEVSLAETLNVSRTPVREAIFRLIQDGLIEKKDNSHFYVRRPSEDEVEEMSQIRVVLTNLIIEKVIDSSDRGLILNLEDNLRQSEEYLERNDNEHLNYALSDFHEILNRGARTRYLYRILHGLLDELLIGRAIMLRLPGVRRLLISDHKRLLEALKEKDKATAKRIMKEHIIGSKNCILQSLAKERLAELDAIANSDGDTVP